MKTQQSAPANVTSASTDAVLVAAVAGKTIRVLAVVLSAGGTLTAFTFNGKLGAAAGVAISPVITLPANVPVILPPNPDGWWDCPQGAALTCTTGTGSTVGVEVTYELR